MMPHYLLISALFSLALLTSPTQAAPVSEWTLDNGLKLVVQEDHRSPIAVVQIWYRVGGAYEYDGITGISHALEHMMFKGTDDLKTGEFSEIVSANGGRQNAFTSADYTAYYQQWGAENVELSFRLEADRMRDLKLVEDEFAREIRVVAEERRLRTDDNPQSYAYEVLRATAYETSPYRQPVVGWAEDIENMSVDDLRDWYRQWYAPNNAIVVVVGDVEPDNVYALAKKHFGPLKPENIVSPKRRPEREQFGTKRFEVKRSDARVPSLMFAFKAPTLPQIKRQESAASEAETYALDVAAALIAGGKSSRLYNSLVRNKKLAASISSGYSSVSLFTSLFYLVATPAPGVALGDLEQAVIEELNAMKSDPPTAEELDRIKTEVIAGQVYEQDSPAQQAILIGSLEAVNLSWRLKEEYVDELAKVSAEQVTAAMSKYLVPDHMTVGHLLPKQPAPTAPAASGGAAQ